MYTVEYRDACGNPHRIPCKSEQDAVEMLRAIFVRSTLTKACILFSNI